MADEPYVLDGQVYQDETAAMVANHPHIPDDIKRIYIYTSDKKEEGSTTSRMPPGGPTEPVGEFNSDSGTPVAPDISASPGASQGLVYPEPYGLNPPEQGPGFAEPKGEPKVIYKTPNGVEITDQDIDKAISVSMGVGAGTMTGITSKTFGRGALAEAQAMEALGHHPEDIWSATGNYKGVDGRWRQEIPDNQAKIKAGAYDTINSGTYPNNKDIRLAHVLEHQDLYNAYPWAQNIKMKIDPGAGSGASYDELMNTIHLGPKAINEETVLHEVQHAIQSREGFAKGGAEAKQFALRYEQDVANMKKEAQTFIDRDKAGDKFTKEDKDRIQVINRVLELDTERRKIASTVAHQNYLKLAGEVESRNTETRILLGAIGRRKFFPEWTQDVKNRDQIVSQKPLWTTPYGATDNPMRAPMNSSKSANIDTGVIPNPGNYGRAIVNQRIKQLEDQGIKIKTNDFNGWSKIAEKEDHKIGSFTNAYKAAKNYSKDGQYTMIIDANGGRTVYYNGRRYVKDLYRDMPDEN